MLYTHYIHPDHRIGDCGFRSGKGAGPLQREHQGSRGGAARGARGSTGEHEGSIMRQCDIRSLRGDVPTLDDWDMLTDFLRDFYDSTKATEGFSGLP